LASLYAFGMGSYWGIELLAYPALPPTVSDFGAYLATGLLGVAVIVSLGAQERRIRKLEQQLRDPDGQAELGDPPDRSCK
jgi:hypothetical protein